MRTFIAVPVVPAPALTRLLTRLAVISPRARPPDASNLHLTLKFLGETDRSQLADIRRAIDEAVAGETASSALLCGLGAFPTADRPSVLWVGLRQAEPLLRIAASLDSACAELGFVKETREFVPHLTIMRFKSRPPDEIFELLQTEQETDFGPIPIEQVIHYESDFTPAGHSKGPTYTPLSTHSLLFKQA